MHFSKARAIGESCYLSAIAQRSVPVAQQRRILTSPASTLLRPSPPFLLLTIARLIVLLSAIIHVQRFIRLYLSPSLPAIGTTRHLQHRLLDSPRVDDLLSDATRARSACSLVGT